jgi:hypothetical protein
VTNERLRAGLASRSMSYTDLSDAVGVHIKTVERWVRQGRVPHRVHRLQVAALLGSTEGYLWPETRSDPQVIAASEAELVAIYPSRAAVPGELWQTLIERCQERIDVLAYAATFLHDSVPDIVDLLAAKAAEGVQTRLLLGDPAAAAVALRGREEGVDELLAARCELAWKFWTRAQDQVPGLEIRRHGTTLYNSLYRFDQTLLVNVHAYGATGSEAPVLHLQQLDGGYLFQHYAVSMCRTWAASQTVMQPVMAAAASLLDADGRPNLERTARQRNRERRLGAAASGLNGARRSGDEWPPVGLTVVPMTGCPDGVVPPPRLTS